MMPLLILGINNQLHIDVDVVFPLNDTTETVGSENMKRLEMNS